LDPVWVHFSIINVTKSEVKNKKYAYIKYFEYEGCWGRMWLLATPYNKSGWLLALIVAFLNSHKSWATCGVTLPSSVKVENSLYPRSSVHSVVRLLSSNRMFFLTVRDVVLSWPLTFCLVTFVVFSNWTADAINNAAGFGFNGYNKDGTPRWDLISNLRILDIEVRLCLF
jgi:hypothetical protein